MSRDYWVALSRFVSRFLLAEALAAGQLEELELDQPAQVMDGVFAVYPATRHPEAKLRAFIDYLVVALRS